MHDSGPQEETKRMLPTSTEAGTAHPLLSENAPSPSATANKDWERFVSDCGLSIRVRNVLAAADIQRIQDLTARTAWEMKKYRGLGRAGLMELRLALARLGLSLAGEPAYSPVEISETVDLKVQLRALEQKRDELTAQIQQLRARIVAERPLKRKPPKDPELDGRILARWKQLREFSAVAKEFGVTVHKVRAVVVRRLR